MSGIKWTDAQMAAIKSRGDVQVAASAGTGKTAVLSHRCIDLLLDRNEPADIDRILVLTFTEDAAAEMKERIAKTLVENARGENYNRLRKQLLRIDISDISTIHSFCRKIIADNFYRLGIDPGFNIIEGDEQKLLRQEILADVVEKAWEDEAFSGKLRSMLEGRNPDLQKGVLKNVYAIDDFLNSLVEPEKWLEMSRRGEGVFVWKMLADILNRRVDVCRCLCEQSQVLDAKLTGGHYADNIKDFSDSLDKLEALIDSGDRCGIEEQIDALVKMKFKTRPRGSDELDYLNARSPIIEIAKKKILAKIREQLVPSNLLSLVELSQEGDVTALLGIVEMFRSEYQKRKQELKCLDFGDLERLALKLLTAEDGDASDVANELRQHYQYVFVDEYQDVNKVQDRIVQLVSRGSNLFIVGDVKQSIYSWRQARPELFLNRIKDAEKSGASNIYLNENFRCRFGIVELVNSVFSELMSEDVAGMDYDSNAALGFGAKSYLPLEQVCTNSSAGCNELHLITAEEQASEGNDELVEETNSNQRQAVVIAKRIEELVGGELKVTDRDGVLRDVSYGDIVILLRSLKGRVNDYVDVLRQYNIPVDASVTGSYFESPEVSDCLSILKVLDNPMRDIEFAAAMRSPVFGFSDSQLLEIRNSVDKSLKAFYNCVLKYVDGGSDSVLVAKIEGMLEVIEQWRDMASRSHLAQVVWKILRHNDFISFASALPGGMQKRADLLKLHERAIQFEGFVSTQGNPSLGRFVDFIERLRDSEGDWSQAEADTPQSSSVWIMSIHKSKGLEFPVVFMPAIEKGFNVSDIKEVCLLDEDLPLGLKVYIPDTGKQYNSDSFNVIRDRKLASSVAEEMRTLYVAMTRAREKLIMIGDTSKKDKDGYGSSLLGRLYELKNLNQQDSLNWWLSDCSSRSYLDWVVGAMRNDVGIFGALQKGGRLDNIDVSIVDAEKICLTDEAGMKPVCDNVENAYDAAIVERLKARLDNRYDYEAVLSLPVKNSVSKITHRGDEFKVDYFAKTFDDIEINKTDSSGAIDPRLVGTATHLVFENLPLDKAPGIEDVRDVLATLESKGAFTPQVAAAISPEQILAFFDTEPGKLIFSDAVVVHREYPFTIGLSPADCGYTDPDEQKGDDIIVQGIIDLLLITPEGMVIVDFKTDNVTVAGVENRALVYEKQLRLYSYATSKILKRSVAAQWLYFLKPKVAYKC